MKNNNVVDPFAPKPIKLKARLKKEGNENLDDIEILELMYPPEENTIRTK